MEKFKEMFNDIIRAVIGGLLTIAILTLSVVMIFHEIPEGNRQMANNIIVFLLGVLSTTIGYYFSGNPSSIKKTPVVNVEENNGDIKAETNKTI